MIDIHLRRVVDGEVRLVREEAYPGWEFMWSDGNYGCDCNRQLMFDQISGGEPTPHEGGMCGHERFAIDCVTDAKTGAVICEGEPDD